MESKILPPTIDLRITGNCNLKCKSCFGPSQCLGDINVDKLIKLIRVFPDCGVKNIVISGGEPLLVKRLPEILRESKSVGLKVILSTNGILFKNKMKELCPYIDWIGLPIDGDLPEVNTKMRGGNDQHFEISLDLVNKIKNNYPNIHIKLGTVVCKINQYNIIGIVNIIKDLKYKPDIWKIYQIVYEGRSLKNKEFLQLSNDDFFDICEKTKSVAKKYNIPVECFYRDDRDGKYLFIEPNGDAVVIKENKEICIGNFFNNFDDIISTWTNFVNVEVLNHNFNNTYPEI